MADLFFNEPEFTDKYLTAADPDTYNSTNTNIITADDFDECRRECDDSEVCDAFTYYPNDADPTWRSLCYITSNPGNQTMSCTYSDCLCDDNDPNCSGVKTSSQQAITSYLNPVCPS